MARPSSFAVRFAVDFLPAAFPAVVFCVVRLVVVFFAALGNPVSVGLCVTPGDDRRDGRTVSSLDGQEESRGDAIISAWH